MSHADRSSHAERAWRAGRREPARDARIKRSAWFLAALAVGFYLAFIAWNLVRSTAGG
jgi:hypothetical protein